MTVSTARDEAFATFVTARSPALLRSAWLMTGNRSLAQDLVQSALVATWSHWMNVVNQDHPETYVRRAMVTTLLTWRRRRWWGERPTEDLPDSGVDDEAMQIAVRLSVRAALQRLSPGQRAAVVLRYFDDLSEADTAAVMGCSVGTVKSQTARAMARLREDPAMAGLWGRATS